MVINVSPHTIVNWFIFRPRDCQPPQSLELVRSTALRKALVDL